MKDKTNQTDRQTKTNKQVISTNEQEYKDKFILIEAFILQKKKFWSIFGYRLACSCSQPVLTTKMCCQQTNRKEINSITSSQKGERK